MKVQGEKSELVDKMKCPVRKKKSLLIFEQLEDDLRNIVSPFFVFSVGGWV